MKSFNPRSVTRRAVAAIFGVSETSVGNWLRDGCPRSKDGTYDTALVYQWLLEREISTATRGAVSGKETASVLEHKERYEKARADSLEIDVAEKLGYFVRTEDVELRWCHALAVLNSTLQALPHSLPMRLVGKPETEIEAALEEALKSSLAQAVAAYAAADDEEDETEGG